MQIVIVQMANCRFLKNKCKEVKKKGTGQYYVCNLFLFILV